MEKTHLIKRNVAGNYNNVETLPVTSVTATSVIISGMETRDHNKNGVSPKNHRSRGNIIKHLFLITVLLVIAVFESIAQDNSLGFLRGQKELNIVLDYSDLKIEKKTEAVYSGYKGKEWAADWENAKTDFFEKFVGGANWNSKYIVCGNKPNAEYTATVKLLALDDDWDMKAEVIFTKTNGNSVFATMKLKGSAGTFGSDTNLTGDAMQDAGKNFGKTVAKNAK